MSLADSAIVFSCEHAGNRVPREFAELFSTQHAQRLLRGHDGYDIGALGLAQSLAAAFGAPLLAATETRLLIDMNRAATNRNAFSELSRRLDAAARRKVIDELHTPHRERVADAVRSALARHAHVVHIAVHSFTPHWDGAERAVDIGLLYDPARSSERSMCACWQSELKCARSQLRVRRNYPYRGVTDGLPTHLRRVFAEASYSGIELEVSQRLLQKSSATMARVIARSLSRCLGEDVSITANRGGE